MMQYLWQRPNWTNFRWQDENLLAAIGRCRFLQGRLLGRLTGIGLSLENNAQLEIITEEALKTAAIEGENLSLKTVRSSVAGKLGLPSAGLSRDRHVDGLVEVLLDATKNHDQPLGVKRLWSWHAALFPTGYSGMHKIAVGKWRGEKPMQVVSGPVGRETVHFEAPPFNRVASEMKDFLKWFVNSRDALEGLLRAAITHFRFVTIHPFADGNGRLGRLWQSLILTRWNPLFADIPVESLVFEHQSEYYQALQESTNRTDSAPFIAFMLRMILDAVTTTAPQVTPQVTPQVGELLATLDGEMSREELQVALKLSDRKSFRERYLKPALAGGLIEMTVPDRPSSRLQKYRLTGFGRRWLERR